MVKGSPSHVVERRKSWHRRHGSLVIRRNSIFSLKEIYDKVEFSGEAVGADGSRD